MPLKVSVNEIVKDYFVRPRDELCHLKNLNEMSICNALFDQIPTVYYINHSKRKF